MDPHGTFSLNAVQIEDSSPPPQNEALTTESAHLNQLHEVLKVLLLVDGELAVVVDDAVVFHLAVAAHTQSVVPGIVGALPHQEQARLRWVEEPLGLLARDFPMEPAAETDGSARKSVTHHQDKVERKQTI